MADNKQDPLLSPWGWPFAQRRIAKSPNKNKNNNNTLFPGDYDWPNIFDEANEMLLASIMIYALADLRTLARKRALLSMNSVCSNHVDDDDDDVDETAVVVDFGGGGGGEDNNMGERILGLPVSTREIVRLVSKNRETILEEIGESYTDLYLSAFDSIHDTTSRLAVCAETGETTFVSSDVVVCEDEYSSEELVYGIWVDSARRRITVTFRGCTTTKDWAIAAHPFLKNIPNPVSSEESHNGNIAIHYGFYAYLNEPSRYTGKTKCEEILSHVSNLLKQYSGYRLYVTGHSLGGALSTVFAFQAAAVAEKWMIPVPVTCINFASPMVGNLAFRRAFQCLERRGHLRCLRVVNSLDMFTKLPDRASSSYLFPVCLPIGPVQYLGMSCLFFMFFQNRICRHVGMGLKLYRHGKYKIKFPKEPDNSILLAAQDWRKHLTLPIKITTTLPFTCCGSCVDCGCCCRVEDFGRNHQAFAYLERLQLLSHELEDKHLNDLYDSIGR